MGENTQRAELQASARQYLDVADLLPEAMLVLARDGTVLGMNRAAHNLLGVRDRVEGRPLTELVTTDPQAIDKYLRKAARRKDLLLGNLSFPVSGGEPLECTTEAGLIRPATASSAAILAIRFVPKAQVSRAFGAINERLNAVGREASRRLRVEDSLRTIESQLRSFLEHAPAQVFIQGSGDRVLLANQRFADEEGKSIDELLGHKLERIWPEERCRLHEEQAQKARTSGREVAFEEEAVTDDGAVRTFLTTKFPMPGPRGQLSVGTISTDITAQREEQEARAVIERKMQEAHRLEELGILAGGIAHDFNNLLVGVLGNVTMLSEDLDLDAPRQDMLVDIERSAEQAADLCRQMLAYAGRTALTAEPVDVGKLTADLSRLVRASVPAHCELNLEISDDLPTVNGDASQLKQVVMNLIINAAESTDEGGGNVSVYVRTCGGPSPAEKRTLFGQEELSPGRYLCVEVTDDGHGMDEETQARIFDPFFSTKFSGRGLGLAAVVGIVKAHHGALSVASHVGEGSTFKFYLPTAEPEEFATETKPKSERSPTPAPRGGLVLVADDEDLVRGTLVRALELSGYVVIAAKNGEAALNTIKERGDELCAAILDVTMPKLSGIEVAKEVDGLGIDLPLLITSGFADDDPYLRLGDKSRKRFIAKPYRMRKLLTALDELTNGSGMGAH